MVSIMSTLRDDPLILSYYVEAMETIVADITDEILEIVHTIVPIEDDDE
jgi:hypothetical protein